MVEQRSQSSRMILLAVLVAVLGGEAAAVGQFDQRFPSPRNRRRLLLESAFEKIQKDTTGLHEFVEKLQEAFCQDSGDGMPKDMQERLKKLGEKAGELRIAVEEADKNLLSFEVYSLAKKIEEEGRELREIFKVLTPRHRRNRFRRMANDIRKKARSVKNKMRLP